MMNVANRWIISAVVLCSCTPAQPRPPAQPDEAYRAFIQSCRQNQIPKAWSQLCPETQSWLTQKASAIALALNEPAPPNGAQMAFTQQFPTLKIKSIHIESQTQNDATLRIEDERDASHQVIMHKTNDQWCFWLNQP